MAIQLQVQGSVGGAAHRRPPFFKAKKLALVGATASVQFAPWCDPAWTIAAHPCARPHCKREPEWYFDMHRPECFRNEHKGWNPKYYTWLKTLQTPVFMQEHWPDIPMSVRYPIERILAEFRPYFTNHCAYMIALAMTEGVTHLGLFGCQYSHDTEHGVQRGSLEYWIGRFEQYGGTVVIPPKYNSLLSRPKGLYGYESHDAEGKLTAEYRPRPAQSVEKATPKGDLERVELVDVDMHSAEGRIPLMPPPNGEPIAWERSGHTVYA